MKKQKKLVECRDKRNFRRTNEPTGAEQTPIDEQPVFVIRKYDASSLGEYGAGRVLTRDKGRA